MIDNFSIFDSHMHYTGTFMHKNENLIEYMDENGIDAAVVNTLNTHANLGVLENNHDGDLLKDIDIEKYEIFKEFRLAGQPDHSEVIKLMQSNPKRIFPFFWYNPADPNDPNQEKGIEMARNALNNGFKGIKLQLAMIPCTIEQLFPVAKLLTEFNLPLYIHPSGGVFASKRTNPFSITELAKKFPDLNIILGHAAYSMEFCVETVFAAMSVPNLYFETSISIPFGIITYIKVFGPQRVLFGTDSPSAGPFNIEYEKIADIKIPREAKQMILSENIKRLIKI